MTVDKVKSGISKQACVFWIMAIYFLSGACSLIDQVVWVRLLKLTLGNTVYASSIVVSVFMGGLAVGAYIMGRYCDNLKSHLKLYALLEGVITISALSLPFLFKFADQFYIFFFQKYDPSNTQLLIVQTLISVILLLIPTMVMGSTLPLLARFVTSFEKEAGHLVGRLYALNTLGAALGCFLAGFFLIRLLGVMGTLYTAAGLNLIVALGGLVLYKFSGVSTEQSVKEQTAAQSIPVEEKHQFRYGLLLLGFFLSGLISIGYEILWMRSVIHLLGGVTYVFSSVLTVYLLGNVIGAGIGSNLARKLKRPAAGFGVTLFLLGLFGFLYLPIVIIWISTVLPKLGGLFDFVDMQLKISPFMAKPFIQSFFLFFIPSLIMGIGFPIALQAWANHIHKVGRSTGTAYCANTIGAVIGGIVAGLLLVPVLGLQLTITSLGFVGVLIGILMFIVFKEKKLSLSTVLFVVIGITSTIMIFNSPSNMFNTIVKITPLIPDWELVDVKEGRTTTVSVHREHQMNALHLHSSGQSVAGDHYVERGDQKMLGHLGVMLHKDAKDVLSVGFGSGETTACLATHNLESVDCVEIAPEIVGVSLNYFNHINLGDQLNEEVHMIFMDAKNYLHLTDKKYDVIVNDSIHPRDFAENSSLYTKEYFENAKKRLKVNGVIYSWLPTYDMPESVFDSIISTVMDVFPYVTVWYLSPQPAPLILIAGSDSPQTYSARKIQDELNKKEVASSLEQIHIDSSMDILNCYVGDQDDYKQVVKNTHINSDFHPFVEFTIDKRTKEEQIFRDYVLTVKNKDSLLSKLDWSDFDSDEKEKWIASFEKVYDASNYLLLAKYTSDKIGKLKLIKEGLDILPDDSGLLSAKDNTEKLIYSDCISLILSGQSNKALAVANDVMAIFPDSSRAWMIRSGAMFSAQNVDKALYAAEQSVFKDPENADAKYNYGFVLSAKGEYKKAIQQYKESLVLSPNQPDVLSVIAQLQIKDRNTDFYNPSAAIENATKACEITAYKNVNALETLASVYVQAGNIKEGIATLAKAIEVAKVNGNRELARELDEKLILLKVKKVD